MCSGLLGIGGACLFFGDGVITPAISVLSAVEGLEVVYPEFSHFVVPISVVVIVALFAVQAHGTGQIGRIFGPIMAVWFTVIAVLGIVQLVAEPVGAGRAVADLWLPALRRRMAGWPS